MSPEETAALQEAWDEEARKLEPPAADTPPVAEPNADPQPSDTPTDPAAAGEPAPDASGNNPSAEPPPKSDPLASLPAPLREKLSNLDKLSERLRGIEGHIGGLTAGQKRLQELVTASQEAARKVQDAPSQAEVKAALATPEKWQALKDEFPDWSEAVEAFVDSRVAGNAPPPVDVDPLVEAKLSKLLPGVRREISEDILDDIVSGWREDVGSEDFAKWAAEQGDDVAKLIASERVSDAAKLVRLYRNSKVDPGKAIKDARKDALEVATAVPKGATVPAAKSPDDMTPAELWEYEARQRAKQRAS